MSSYIKINFKPNSNVYTNAEANYERQMKEWKINGGLLPPLHYPTPITMQNPFDNVTWTDINAGAGTLYTNSKLI